MVVLNSSKGIGNRRSHQGAFRVCAGFSRAAPARQPRHRAFLPRRPEKRRGARAALQPSALPPNWAAEDRSIGHRQGSKTGLHAPILGAMTVHFPFQNSYAALPDNFFARVAPTPVTAPRLITLNRPLAAELGLDPAELETPEGAAILAGKTVPEGAEPIAMAYAGHQFGHFVPQLGDGRAILLGEVIDGDGVRRDIQLKGSGPTPFSRRGDGRAALGPVLREY